MPNKNNNSNRQAIWRKFLSDRHGNTVIIFAAAASALLATSGAALDYTHLVNQKTRLQKVADAAAVAGANEMYIAQANDARIDAVTRSVADATLDADKVFDLAATSDRENGTLKIAMKQEVDLAFGEFLGMSSSTIEVEAEAQIVGSGRICMIGLEPQIRATVSLKKNAVLNAPNCSIFSNSANRVGLIAKNGAKIVAELTCTAGGYSGGGANFKPAPLTDCPQIPDPLSKRPAPDVGACDFNSFLVSTGVHVLKPGTYCGGLFISGNASVTFGAGIYVIKDGPLIAQDQASIYGLHVGFYFNGENQGLQFTENTKVDLSAPKSGTMAGILFFQERDKPEEESSVFARFREDIRSFANERRSMSAKGTEFEIWVNDFRISSNFAKNLLGTIYLSNGRLYVDAQDDIAEESAYTAIVARKIELSEGPVLHLNTDYTSTDIPVPAGVGPVGGNVVLTR